MSRDTVLLGPSLLGATILLCLVGVLQAFAIEKKGDVFKKMACPAFLTFENVAYLADMTFKLPCKCKPEEVSSVIWYFQKNLHGCETTELTDFNGTVVLDSSHIHTGSDLLKRFSIPMFRLIMFRAQVRDSGHYLCGSKEGCFLRLLHLRSPEVAVRSCLALCPPKEVPKEGVQSISNIIYKFGEKPVSPSRTDLVITCPGACLEHTVGWDKDSVWLYRSQYLMGVGKGMRVFIDHRNHLQILWVRRNNRGTYFCWRDGEMMAGFWLTSITFPAQHRCGPESIFIMRAIGISFAVISSIFFLAHLGRCCWWVLRKPSRL
ncbi:LOW QUALITY PROTEIN: Ig-like V-type domain-containing protein FAM187A [Chiroxiphia lanceolata]|uniref:LOW QUALITY PROTEIN: Ig-like V-type domain-containing protein FAM187A n=1 Tax=Chiroxiphia lanceolata TaxID=296741 RepID=UPI0013CF3396|nr:LOW QUALITY PROTEIN: Ig-like V-type domain-containing protein FAM187A [Chiroxiphia lanceolata]